MAGDSPIVENPAPQSPSAANGTSSMTADENAQAALTENPARSERRDSTSNPFEFDCVEKRVSKESDLEHGSKPFSEGLRGRFLPVVKVEDITAGYGAARSEYLTAVESLSFSLSQHGAAILQMGSQDAQLVRCGLESSRFYFSRKAGQMSTSEGHNSTSPKKQMFFYRAGRLEMQRSRDQIPPCLPEVNDCLDRISRTALGAICRHLKLRTDALSHVMDDYPLAPGEVSSSTLTASGYVPTKPSSEWKDAQEAVATSTESEKGLVMLVAADTPGLQVCDDDGNWFLVDKGVPSNCVVLLTGQSLFRLTAGLLRPSNYRVAPFESHADEHSFSSTRPSRCAISYRLMPQTSASLDCSVVARAGYDVPDEFKTPVSVSSFLESLVNGGLSSEERRGRSSKESVLAMVRNLEGTSLRTILSDPISGSLLEDAVVAPCGHSFGSSSLRELLDKMVCFQCGNAVDVHSLVPNLALRAAVVAFRQEEASMKRFQGPSRNSQSNHGKYYFGGGEGGLHVKLSKRKREKDLSDPTGGHGVSHRRKERMMSIGALDHPLSPDGSSGDRMKGVQFPYTVNDYVLIKGNKRTPEKFVGREAVITSQCLNGWYLVRTLDTGESVRLQYRSLRKISSSSHPHNGLGAEGRGEYPAPSAVLAITDGGMGLALNEAGDLPCGSPPFNTSTPITSPTFSPHAIPLSSAALDSSSSAMLPEDFAHAADTVMSSPEAGGEMNTNISKSMVWWAQSHIGEMAALLHEDEEEEGEIRLNEPRAGPLPSSQQPLSLPPPRDQENGPHRGEDGAAAPCARITYYHSETHIGLQDVKADIKFKSGLPVPDKNLKARASGAMEDIAGRSHCEEASAPRLPSKSQWALSKSRSVLSAKDGQRSVDPAEGGVKKERLTVKELKTPAYSASGAVVGIRPPSKKSELGNPERSSGVKDSAHNDHHQHHNVKISSSNHMSLKMKFLGPSKASRETSSDSLHVVVPRMHKEGSSLSGGGAIEQNQMVVVPPKKRDLMGGKAFSSANYPRNSPKITYAESSPSHPDTKPECGPEVLTSLRDYRAEEDCGATRRPGPSSARNEMTEKFIQPPESCGLQPLQPFPKTEAQDLPPFHPPKTDSVSKIIHRNYDGSSCSVFEREDLLTSRN